MSFRRGGEIVDVVTGSQAHAKGVKRGWKIVKILGYDVYDVHQIENQMKRLKQMVGPAAVSFLPHPSSPPQRISFNATKFDEDHKVIARTLTEVVPSEGPDETDVKSMQSFLSHMSEDRGGTPGTEASVASITSKPSPGKSDLPGFQSARHAKSLKCDVCGLKFTTREVFRAHVQLHVTAPASWAYSCKQCHTRFRTLEEHSSHNCPRRRAVCHHCGVRMSSEVELLVHLDERTANNNTCSERKIITSSLPNPVFRQGRTTLNERQKRRLEKFQKYSQRFDDNPVAFYMDDDITEPSDSAELWPCGRCTRFFYTKEELDNHVQGCKLAQKRKELRKKIKQTEEPKKNETQICNRCNKEFRRKKELLRHVYEVHEDEMLRERKRREASARFERQEIEARKREALFSQHGDVTRPWLY
mmetsp:Transcript_1132/g.2586  ORF Transcript_1132/g.2586 Transcript_1132/m.2586 type:complete len:416 (-) Transcript_1132:195-1442(-)